MAKREQIEYPIGPVSRKTTLDLQGCAALEKELCYWKMLDLSGEFSRTTKLQKTSYKMCDVKVFFVLT